MTSTIKVDNIQKVSDGSSIIKKCGTTTTVGSGSGQTIVVDGATVTLGRCGGAVNLASGATQTGFGRTGTVDWCTTAKTSPFTAVSGDGFFVNTTGGTITVTLPSSPSAGDIVAFADYANTWACNAVTICRAGEPINGGAINAVLDVVGQSVTLVYVDGTRGWKNVQDSTSNVTGAPAFIVATGGTIVTCGDFKTHIFTSSSTFSVSTAPTPANNTVDYFTVAGGGGNGSCGYSGSGGAGGFRLSNDLCSPGPTTSPLAAPTGISVSVADFTITVGAGGAAGVAPGNKGSPGGTSTFSTITSAGGGGAGYYNNKNSLPGGSGGGGSFGPGSGSAGTGNDPPVSPPQGNSGGTGSSSNNAQGGAGGAGAAGGNGGPPNTTYGVGGVGSYIADPFIGPTAPSYGTPGPVGSARYFSGGGHGGSDVPQPGARTRTAGGGGAATPCAIPLTPGQTNTGGGSGGRPSGAVAGGSGIVMIRYKFQ